MRVVSYAQNREDILLAAFFADDEIGFYVDVGACHPVLHSVTKYFYDRGWRGMNIEPLPAGAAAFAKGRPRDINLQLGISDEPGRLPFRIYSSAEGVSTFSAQMKEHHARHGSPATTSFRDVEVEVRTLRQVLDEHDVSQISFLKVDVEGHEYEVLAGNDWERHRPEVLCIEVPWTTRDWHPLLARHGYEQVFFDGVNEYFVADEASHRKEAFDYVEGVLCRPVIEARWEALIQQAEREAHDLRRELEELRGSPRP